jgi:hypothetical protein
MKVYKLQVNADLVGKLNRIMQYRRPPQPPLGIETPLYDTSGNAGIYNWPPQNNVSVVVSENKEFNSISYGIYVRKRRQIVLYTYCMYNGEWHSHVNKFPM